MSGRLTGILLLNCGMTHGHKSNLQRVHLHHTSPATVNTHRIEESFLAQLCSPVVTLEDPAEGNVSAQLWLHLRLVSLFPLGLIGSPRWKLYTR